MSKKTPPDPVAPPAPLPVKGPFVNIRHTPRGFLVEAVFLQGKSVTEVQQVHFGTSLEEAKDAFRIYVATVAFPAAKPKEG